MVSSSTWVPLLLIVISDAVVCVFGSDATSVMARHRGHLTKSSYILLGLAHERGAPDGKTSIDL